jgi:hypothetical protein
VDQGDQDERSWLHVAFGVGLLSKWAVEMGGEISEKLFEAQKVEERGKIEKLVIG